MNTRTIGLVGGSGFVGSTLANQLVEHGYKVRILTRERQHARHLWLLPDTDVIAVNSNDQNQLDEALSGCAAVVNLVSILNERGDNGRGFREVNVDLTARIAKACKTVDVPHLVQFSALNADSFAASYYLRSKGDAEKLLAEERNNRLAISVVRPSVIFGPHDSLTNRFHTLLQLAPGVFPLAGANTRFQPVYVGDVAGAVVRILSERDCAGQRYEFGGPEVMTLAELVRYVGEVSGQRDRVIALGPMLSKIQANVLEYVPGKPFSRDNLRSMSEDSVCRGANGLETLGIVPTPMDIVVPGYLGQRHERNRYYGFRAAARRD